MSGYSPSAFAADCRRHVSAGIKLADTVVGIAPLMRRLLYSADEFLKPEHFRSDPDHYARNLVFNDEDVGICLYTLVWLPGQWTPIHDHGTWGVVGVVEGQLDEQAYLRSDPYQTSDRHYGIDLQRGGLMLLAPGSVSTFVPNPDHIHRTGCAEDQERCVSLHLYGRAMNSFHAYDAEAGTRELIDVAHEDTQLGKSG